MGDKPQLACVEVSSVGTMSSEMQGYSENHRQVYASMCVCVWVRASEHSQVCGALAVCSLLWLWGRVYPLPPSANAALPAHPTGPLAPLSGRLVWSSVPNGLTPGPVFQALPAELFFRQLVRGPFCWVVVTQAGQLEGIRRG